MYLNSPNSNIDAAKNRRYLLQLEIGKGGMGTVYLATDRLNQQQIALKQIRIDLANLDWLTSRSHGTNLRETLAREFEILAGLRHPNIIGVKDYGFDHANDPFYTMDYLADAQSILDASRGLKPPEKFFFIEQTLQALSYLHRWGILHRDLKPNNVLVTDGKVRLVDFGLASYKGENIPSAGTLLYMSPEMLTRDNRPFVEASDLYGVGVMMYEMIAGEHPFDITSGDFAQQVLTQPPDLNKLDVNEAIRSIVGRLLAKRPEERYESAEACQIALSTALGQPAPKDDSIIRESFLQAAKFVGREAEMDQLSQALDAADEGSSSFWLIGGESGVGKTRLIQEIRIKALVSGWQTLTGQGIAEGGVPYQLWQEIVPQLALGVELSELEAGVLKQVSPEIELTFTQKIPDPPELDGDAAQQRLIFILISVLARQTKNTLLILEDLQWAQQSLVVLSHLIDSLEEKRGLVVVSSYRDDERSDLPELLSGAQHLKLNRLNDAHIADLGRAILGDVERAEQIAGWLSQETEGNTFFIVEALRALAEESGRLATVGQMSLPESILTSGMQALLQRRIHKLSQADQGLLQLAAVAGRELDLRLLQGLNGERNLDHWLTRSSNAAVLNVTREAWQFAHDKLRESLLDQLDDRQRVALHQQVALQIEQTYPDDPTRAGQLARHWRVIGAPDRERSYARQAGEYAHQQLADEDAISYLNQALALTPADTIQELYELYLLLEELHEKRGNAEEWQSCLDSLETLMGQVSLRQKGDILLRQGYFAYYLGNYDDAIAYVEKLIPLTKKIDDPTFNLRPYILWGLVLRTTGKYESALSKFQQALSRLDAEEVTKEKIELLYQIGIILNIQGKNEEGLTFFEDALNLSNQVDGSPHRGDLLNSMGIITSDLGEIEKPMDYFYRSLQTFRNVGNIRSEKIVLNNLGLTHYKMGLYEQARDYIQEGLDIATRDRELYMQVVTLSNLGRISLRVGEYQAALGYCEKAVEISRPRQMAELPVYIGCLGDAWAHLGENNKALSFLTEAIELLPDEVATSTMSIEIYAIYVRVHLAEQTNREALNLVNEMLDLTQTTDFWDTFDPFLIYLTCYQVLHANHDSRAKPLLAQAYGLLQEKADQIDRVEYRRSFLENVPHHCEIVQLYHDEF